MPNCPQRLPYNAAIQPPALGDRPATSTITTNTNTTPVDRESTATTKKYTKDHRTAGAITTATTTMSRLLRLLGVITLLLSLAIADSAPQNHTQIFKGSKKYKYHGCYNETTDITQTTNNRALANGKNEVKIGEMTVPMCLSFCGDGDVKYRFAGLEWSRECWCAQSVSELSKKLPDSECSFPCEGNDTMACGGALKLSVYDASAALTGVATSGMLILSGLAMAWVA